MKAEPLLSASVPISQQPKDRFRSDANEEAIQACCDLLSSGHSLSQILVALKQLGPLNKAQSELVDAPGDPQIPHLAGEIAAPPQSEIIQVAEPTDVSRSLVPLIVEPSQQRARDEEKWTRPIGVVLFWLIPAMTLMLVCIAGKLLIDGGLLRNSGSATTGAETFALMPAITEVGRTAPERLEAVRAGEPAVTASSTEPATQAVGTAPAKKQDRRPLIDKGERPEARSLPPPTRRPSSAQRLQSQIYRSSPKEWGLPRRPTDGF
jgi:hypothetical protein